MQKTLIAKVRFDVSPSTPRQIEALKGYIRASFETIPVDFELEEIDEAQAARDFYQQIIAEFTEAADSGNSEPFEGIRDLLRNDTSKAVGENTDNG